jgi:hypothetical protein
MNGRRKKLKGQVLMITLKLEISEIGITLKIVFDWFEVNQF